MVNNPTQTLIDMIQTAIESHMINVHTSLPVEVVAVNADTQSVDCKIVVNRLTQDDSILVFDILKEVPIGYTKTSKYNISFPINIGDTGQVIFNERQLDSWIVNGEIKEPDDFRKHSLSDGLFLPNFYNRQNLISNLTTTDLEIRTSSGNGKISIAENGKIEIERDGNKVLQTLSDALNVLSTATVTVTAGSSAGTYNLDQQSQWASFKSVIDIIKK